MTTAQIRRTAAATTAALLLTSCGSLPEQLDFLASTPEFLQQSPRAMAKDAFADMRDVTSMRIIGNVNTAEFGAARMDFRLRGTTCAGTFDTDDGGVKFVQNEDGRWFGLDNDMWRSQAPSPKQAAQVLDRYSGTWFAAGKKDLAKLCDIDKLLGGFEVDDADRGTIDVGTIEQVGDVRAVPLSGRDGKTRCTLWIAVDSPHRVVKMTQTKDNQVPEEFSFEEFGTDVDAESPDKKDIVALPAS